MTDPLRLLDDRARTSLRRWPGGTWQAPALATPAEPFSGRGWLFERKLDGVRLIAGAEGEGPQLWSRNRKRADTAYPEIVEALAGQAAAQFVIDGEVVALEGDRTSFARLQQRMHLTDPAAARRTGVTVQLHVFDLIAFGGVDLTRLPLRTRKALLAECFEFADPLVLGEHRETDGAQFFRQACADGWEGLIAKRAEAPYRPGRGRDWLKLKCVSAEEFVVGGYTDPQGSRTGFGALLVGYYQRDALRYAGKVGTGYDRRTLRELRDRLDGLARGESPFADPVAEPGAHWVDPELVAQVGFSEWTPDGRLRHPRFRGLRNDKRPVEVRRED
ncbi:non-homologous end-joining DNA ligase [Saccharopolyspora griseoalba]|uniref:DNA ligase (ATP) n=1 Tax=Saccharopolyspora griseoalba TaxID=1431848 RepID=A0ABW2LPK3_9PSEU